MRIVMTANRYGSGTDAGAALSRLEHAALEPSTQPARRRRVVALNLGDHRALGRAAMSSQRLPHLQRYLPLGHRLGHRHCYRFRWRSRPRRPVRRHHEGAAEVREEREQPGAVGHRRCRQAGGEQRVCVERKPDRRVPVGRWQHRCWRPRCRACSVRWRCSAPPIWLRSTPATCGRCLCVGIHTRWRWRLRVNSSVNDSLKIVR